MEGVYQMLQFKIFELFNFSEEDIKKVQNIFVGNDVILLDENYMVITYDYATNSYIELLKKAKKVENIRQVILTSKNFFNLINYAVNTNSSISDLKFVSQIPEESIEFVHDYIELINSSMTEKKGEFKNRLFNELDWLIYDECIDIEKLSILTKFGDSRLYKKVELYSNGVVIVNSDCVSDEVKKLVLSIIKGIVHA